MNRNKVDSKYARSQMEKHGWREGAGLGRTEHGMKDIIRVQLRTTRSGVGHDLSKEFTNNWWEDVYNNSVKSLKVESGKDGAVVSMVKVDSKKKKKAEKMSLLYGRFRKGATLTTSEQGQVEEKHDNGSDDESSDEDKPKKYLTFEEMFQACEGRTCHRGVRHGHSVSAKLKRVEEQDRALLAGQSLPGSGHSVTSSHPTPSTPVESLTTEGKKKKRKRRKERKEVDEEETPTSNSSEETCEPIKSKGENSVLDLASLAADCDLRGDLEQQKKRKRKKQKKEKREEESDDSLSSDVAGSANKTPHTASIVEEEVSKKDKKKKKKKREEKLGENWCNGFSAENGGEGSEKKTKKRKRRKEGENFDENCADCEEEETNLSCSHSKLSVKKAKAEKSDTKVDNSDAPDSRTEKVSKKKRKKDDE